MDTNINTNRKDKFQPFIRIYMLDTEGRREPEHVGYYPVKLKEFDIIIEKEWFTNNEYQALKFTEETKERLKLIPELSDKGIIGPRQLVWEFITEDEIKSKLITNKNEIKKIEKQNEQLKTLLGRGIEEKQEWKSLKENDWPEIVFEDKML